jgi:hypothetical protein
MAVQAIVNPQHIGHLWEDVLALFVVAAALAFLMPKSVEAANAARAA